MISRFASAVLAVVLALTGATMTTMGMRALSPPAAAAAAPVVLSAPRVAPAASVPSAPAPSAPVRLDIPAIGVHTRLIRLGLEPDGSMQVPALDSDAPAGWYVHSPSPGEPGVAVLAGHVDSARDGPAVFYHLGELRPGDPITVRRADGTRVVFAVTAVRLYPKSNFPADQVWTPADRAELVLITCGGDFDRKRRKYRSNLLVFANLQNSSVGTGS